MRGRCLVAFAVKQTMRIFRACRLLLGTLDAAMRALVLFPCRPETVCVHGL